MLCELSRVDWANVGPANFITLTYPDERVHWTPALRNKQRFLFWRGIEQEAQRHVAGFWRVEWLPRKSGNFVGRVSPHIHMIAFNGGQLDKEWVRSAWKAVLGVTRKVQVDCQSIPGGKAVSYYIAKYCGKVNKEQRLDIVPYLNSTGRHWGITRKPLMPRCDLREAFIDKDEHVKWLQTVAATLRPEYDPGVDKGFTILGQLAPKILQEARARGIDVWRIDSLE